MFYLHYRTARLLSQKNITIIIGMFTCQLGDLFIGKIIYEHCKLKPFFKMKTKNVKHNIFTIH